MSYSETDHPRPPATAENHSAGSQPPRRSALRSLAGVIQVRARFVLVFLAAFVLVGKWEVLRTYWDRFTADHLKQDAEPVSVDTDYFCPMDPGVESSWPARCPVCNMALVRRRKADHGHLPDGALSRMQFSPYRLQLAGIRTALVEFRPLTYSVVLVGIAQRQQGDQLIAQFEVGPGQAQQLVAGQAIELSCLDLPGQGPWMGHLSRVREASDDATRLRSLDMRLDAPLPVLPAQAKLRGTLAISVAETAPYSAADSPLVSAGKVLSVPESAVIDNGTQRIVYRESGKGMFDAVEVRLGDRAAGFYPVLGGLESGQLVAAAGAFLIDAETRLDPSLAATYFGAARPATAADLVVVPDAVAAFPGKPRTSDADARKIAKAIAELAPSEQLAARSQVNCPVTGLPLGSMGKPVAVRVAGQVVFICCDGCEQRLRDEPSKYLPRPSAGGAAKP